MGAQENKEFISKAKPSLKLEVLKKCLGFKKA